MVKGQLELMACEQRGRAAAGSLQQNKLASFKGAKASRFVPSLFLTWSWKVKTLVYARVDSKRVFGTIYCPNKFGKHWIMQSWLAVGFSEPLMCKCVVLVSSFRDVSLAKRTVNQAVCRRGSSPSTKHLRLICHFPNVLYWGFFKVGVLWDLCSDKFT